MFPFSFSHMDYCVILLYFIGLFWIISKLSSCKQRASEFFLAGRRITLPFFVATLVSTCYGSVVGVVEIAYQKGLYNWLTQGFCWYVVYLLFALFFAGKIQSSSCLSLPEQMESFYGKTAGKMAAYLSFINVIPVVYVLSLAVLMKHLLGISLNSALFFSAFLCLFYVFYGGYRAVVMTDFFQALMMYLGVFVLVLAAYVTFGGKGFLFKYLPEEHLKIHGGQSWGDIMAWFLIALGSLVDPNFYQRCYSAQDVQTAKKGVMLSIFLWFLFDCATTLIGLYAVCAFPDIDPKSALMLLAQNTLPSGVKGLFYVGLISAVMSTLDSYLFVGGQIMAQNILGFFSNSKGEKTLIFWTRMSMLFCVSLALLFNLLWSPSIEKIWKVSGGLSVSCLLVPLVYAFIRGKKCPSYWGVYSILGGAGGFFSFYFIPFNFLPFSFKEAIYPGLLSSFIALILSKRCSHLSP